MENLTQPGPTAPLPPPEPAPAPTPTPTPTPAQTPTAPPPPAPNQGEVTMMDKDGNVGTVPADRVDGAKASGYRTVYRMVGEHGQEGYVTEDKVASARAHKYALVDQPGVRPMIAPTSREGTKVYVLPNEVEGFAKNGHHILPTAEEEKILADDLAKGRAQQSAITRVLGIQPSAQSPEAQKIRDMLLHYQTMELANSPYFREQVKDKAIGGAVVVGAPAAIATVNAAPVAATAGLRALGQGALPGLEEEAGKAILKQAAKYAGKKVVGGALVGAGIKWGPKVLGKLLDMAE